MSQTQTFDPYYTWLGIPPEEQPPNHYRLLGIKLFETNSDVIANAADQRVRHVRTYQSGKYADQSQEVLNKLSAARNCLLNPQTKTDYDEQLKKETKSAPAAPAPAAARPKPAKLPVAQAIEDPGLGSPMPMAAPLGGQPSPHMHPQPGMAPAYPGGPLQPAPAQGVPAWMILAGLGVGGLVMLVMVGIAVAMVMGNRSNPPIVSPGPNPGPGPGPFVRPNPGPRPGPAPSPFVPVPGPGPVVAGPNDRPKLPNGAQGGDGSDPASTIGLAGEIRVGPVHVLVRYRLGETIDGSLFDKFRQDHNVPPQIPLGLVLRGLVDVPRPCQAQASMDVMGATPRNTRLLISGQPWINHVNMQSGHDVHEKDLPVGTAMVEWTIDDITSGKWRLELVSLPDHLRVPVATQANQLNAIRANLRGPEYLFATKPLLVSNSGGTLSATEIGGAAVTPGVLAGSLQPPLPSDAVAGAEDDLNTTTGMLGRLLVNGQDVGVLIRYRLGGTLTQIKLNEVIQALGLPTGRQRVVFTGQLPIAQRIMGEAEQEVGTQASGEISYHDGRRKFSMNLAGRGQPLHNVQSGPLQAGAGKLNWEVDGTDFGTSRLTMRDKTSRTPLQAFYTKSELDDARRQAPTVAEMIVLADKILFRDKETLVASVPRGAGAVASEDAIVVGDEEDAATTTGLLGRLLIDGQDTGILFRYRLGRSFNSGWFDDIRRQLNLPAGQPELILSGTIDVPKTKQFGPGAQISSKMSGGSRNGGTSTLDVDGSSWFNFGGANYSTSSSHFAYLQPGRHTIKWTIRGAPIGDCSLSVTSNDRTQTSFQIGYAPSELKTARRSPLKHEFIMADKNTIAMRYAAGKVAEAQKISTDPTVRSTVVLTPSIESGPAAKREPIPTDDKLKAAETLVRDVLGKEMDAAKNVADKAAVAKKLLQNSRETSDDLAARYVLLTKCKDFAAAAGDTGTMATAIDELDELFDVDGLKLKSSGYFQASKAALPPAEFGPMSRELIDLIDATIAEDRFDLAVKLVDVATECARRSKDNELIKQSGDKKRDITAFKKQFDTIDAALQKLKDSPEDGLANQTIGKYKALVKGDWAAALPHLEKGTDGAVVAAAKLDAAGATDKDGRVKLGDAWWDIGDKAADEDKLGYKLRAHHWYKQALPELDGIAKLKVEKRVNEVDDEASKVASRAKPGAAGATRPQPGLVARVFDGDPTRNMPTHMLAIVTDSDEIRGWVETAARDEARRVGTTVSTHYVLIGYIYLTANTTVNVDVTYAAISIDKTLVTEANYQQRQFPIQLTKGLHPVTIVCNNTSSMKFSFLDQKSGTNVLYHDAKQLQTELGRSVTGRAGQTIKSAMLQRKAGL